MLFYNRLYTRKSTREFASIAGNRTVDKKKGRESKKREKKETVRLRKEILSTCDANEASFVLVFDNSTYFFLFFLFPFFLFVITRS